MHFDKIIEAINVIAYYKKYSIGTFSILILSLLTTLFVYDASNAQDNAHITHFSAEQLTNLINQSIPNNELKVTATPEVIAEMNHIMDSVSARNDLSATLRRLQIHQTMITAALKDNNMPSDLMVIPMIESQYQQHARARNLYSPSGLWQMIVDTARKYGLRVTWKHDDRLDPNLQTVAALKYLNDLYTQFKDWNLAIIAFKLGDAQAASLYKRVHSNDAWTIVRSSKAPKDLKKYLAKVHAEILILHNQYLVND